MFKYLFKRAQFNKKKYLHNHNNMKFELSVKNSNIYKDVLR